VINRFNIDDTYASDHFFFLSYLVFVVVVHLVVVALVVTLHLRDAHLGVDDIVALDPGFAGELSVPHGLGVVLAAGLLLAVTKNLSVAVAAVAITVALALTERLPLDVVVRNVRVVDGLLSVTVFGGGNSGESQKNDSDLIYWIDNEKIQILILILEILHSFTMLAHLHVDVCCTGERTKLNDFHRFPLSFYIGIPCSNHYIM